MIHKYFLVAQEMFNLSNSVAIFSRSSNHQIFPLTRPQNCGGCKAFRRIPKMQVLPISASTFCWSRCFFSLRRSGVKGGTTPRGNVSGMDRISDDLQGPCHQITWNRHEFEVNRYYLGSCVQFATIFAVCERRLIRVCSSVR